jgi:hypothetical protein
MGNWAAQPAAPTPESAVRPADHRNDPPGRPLAAVQSSPIRPEVLRQPAVTPPRTTAPAPAPTTARAANPAPATGDATPAAAPAPAVRSGHCLVICTYTRERDLRDVQSYFATKGVRTEIGRFSNKYVLYSVQTFAPGSGAELEKLKAQVIALGQSYNQEKPKDAAIFLPATFEGAYPVRVESIE